MARDVLQVDFRPDGTEPKADNDIIWSVIGALAIVAAVAIFIHILPFLVAVLVVAAILAGFSTWRTGKQRRLWHQLGWPTERVGVKTYLGFLAAWFVGLLAVVPLLFLGIAVAVVVLILVGIILIVALLASLLRID